MTRLQKAVLIGNILAFMIARQFGEIMASMENADVSKEMRQILATVFALAFGIEAVAFAINMVLGLIASANSDSSSEDTASTMSVHWGVKALWYGVGMPLLSFFFWILNDILKGTPIDSIGVQALCSYGAGYAVQLLTIKFISL